MTAEYRPRGLSPNSGASLDLDIGKDCQPLFTIERKYIVHCIALHSGILYIFIVSDDDVPTWMPAAMFRIVDRSIGKDWIVNVEMASVDMVIGPHFIASDDDAYEAMVDMHPDSLALLAEL